MQRKYLLPLVGLAILLLGWYWLGGSDESSAAITVTPQQGKFVVEVSTSGELRAKNSTKIKGPSGMREFRLFNVKIQKLIPEGSVVSKGDFVAELDKSEVMSKMQDAKLELQKVQSQFEQAQLDSTLTLSEARNNLVNLGYTVEERKIALEQSKYESPAVQRQAQIDLDKAERQMKQEKDNYATKVKQAEAKLREIEAELQKKKNDMSKIQKLMMQFRVTAPEDGMVIYKREWNGKKLVEGGSISAWDPVVAELPDFSIMESVTYVNEVDIQKIKTGQSVDIELDADPDKSLTGEVTSVANIGEQSPNSNSKVFEVTVRVNESDTTLRPAMTTSNTIKVDALEDVMYVPVESIHTNGTINYVYKREGLSPIRQQIELGVMNDDEIVIKQGLSMKDEIYLSLPADTAGLSIQRLPEKLTESR